MPLSFKFLKFGRSEVTLNGLLSDLIRGNYNNDCKKKEKTSESLPKCGNVKSFKGGAVTEVALTLSFADNTAI